MLIYTYIYISQVIWGYSLIITIVVHLAWGRGTCREGLGWDLFTAYRILSMKELSKYTLGANPELGLETLLNLEFHEMCFRGRQESQTDSSSYLRAPEMAQHTLYPQDWIFCLKPEFWTRTPGPLGIWLQYSSQQLGGIWMHRRRIPQLTEDFPVVLGWFELWGGPGTPLSIYCPVSAPHCATHCWVLRFAHSQTAPPQGSQGFHMEWQLPVWQVTAWKAPLKNKKPD